MSFKMRLFPRVKEKPIVQMGPFHSATPQVGDPIEVPVENSTVKAMVVGVYRTHHLEEIDVVDAYEEPPPRLVTDRPGG